MKRTNALLTLALLLTSSGIAHAGAGNTLSLQGLKAKCNELQANEQLKPFKAVVSCKQVATEWRPASAAVAPVEVSNYKEIGASFSLKGYQVPFEAEPVQVGASFAACTALEEYSLTVPAVDIELECAALDAVESIADICGPAIDARVTADPSIVIEEPTGKKFNTCSGK